MADGRPSYDDLVGIAGYVRKIWIEQVDDRDQLWFGLEVHRELFAGTDDEVRIIDYYIYLDENPTVGLAQLQLLRSAMDDSVPVALYYDYQRDRYSRVYYVKLYAADFWGDSYPDDPLTYQRWRDAQ